MRSLVVGAVCLLLGACAYTPTRGLHPVPGIAEGDWVSVRIHETWWGFTTCGSTGTSWLNISGDIPTHLEGEVRAHELKHLEIAKRYPTCKAMDEAVRKDPNLKVRHEAEAWCAGAKWGFENGNYPSMLMAVMAAADRFSWYYWNGNINAAAKEMITYCFPPV